MEVVLREIPGIDTSHQTCWKIRALEIGGGVPVLDDLQKWEKAAKADYKKIMKVMRLVAQQDRVKDEKHVKKSTNPDDKDVYEMRAHIGHARLMFFYSEQEKIVICTNTFWKGKGNQDQAFQRCAKLKKLYHNLL